jgi:hypothetical protein
MRVFDAEYPLSRGLKFSRVRTVSDTPKDLRVCFLSFPAARIGSDGSTFLVKERGSQSLSSA